MKNILRKQSKSLKAKIFRQDTEEDKKKLSTLSDKSEGGGFSGSGYNAKGNVDHGKIKSNKKRR